MKNIRWFLMAICVLKVGLYTLCLVHKPNAEEIEQFIKDELSRKYQDHSFELGFISAASMDCSSISEDSIKHYLRHRNEDEVPLYEQTRFQEYAKYLHAIDTLWQSETNIDLNDFPYKLRNTVAEESAKQEIYLHIKNLEPRSSHLDHVKLIGLLSDVMITEERMQIDLVPFMYNATLSFDYCKCNSQTYLTETNPFHYTGPLSDWECTYQHPIAKEIQVYEVQEIK